MQTTELPDLDTIRKMIVGGFLDDYLRALRNDIDERLHRTREFIEFVQGDRVVLNDYCGTKYLRGEKATVVGERGKKIAIRFDRSIRRFSSERDVFVPPEMLDKI
jgi:hypothetical protein